MKKFISVLLALMLAVTCFTTISLAAEGATASVSQSQNVNTGDTVTLTVAVNGNFTNYEMTVSVDSKLSIEGITGITKKIAADKASAKVAFATDDNIDEHTFNVTVKVADDATPGSYDVTAIPTLAYKRVPAVNDNDGVVDGRVAVNFASGVATLTIKAPAAPTPTAKPTPTVEPTPTAKPTPTVEPTPTAKPSATAKPTEKTTHVHSWSEGKVTKEATCTDKGEMTRTCKSCGEKETKKIDALGHKLSKDWLTDKDSHWHVCERCDKIFDHDDHDFPQDWFVDRKPTASKDGIKHRSCKVCDYTQTGTIPYEPDLDDDVPTTGDMTSHLVLGAVAVLGLLTAAVLVFKRKAVK